MCADVRPMRGRSLSPSYPFALFTGGIGVNEVQSQSFIGDGRRRRDGGQGQEPPVISDGPIQTLPGSFQSWAPGNRAGDPSQSGMSTLH